MTTETEHSAYRVASGEGLADVWWKTGRVTVKAGSAETSGRIAQIEVNDPRGSAPPLHLHREDDELYYVIEGELTVLVGNERIDLSAGDFAFAPHGVVHSYIVRSPQARALVTISPAGLEGMFVEGGVPVAAGQQPAEEVMPPIEEMVELAARYGCEILGPPPTLDQLD